jgi:4-amino-4-deoxy-L-arabinose transferase-like glycosyltransferase
VLIVALLGIHAWGIGWGLPSEFGWAPDEVLPQAVDAGWAQRFAAGWHDKYPPLHFVLLGLVQGALRRATVALGGSDVQMALILAGRALSLAMAAVTLLCLYLAVRTVDEADAPSGDDLAALLAVALAGLSAPFVFYAKLANLDVPYLCWFALSLVFLLRVLDRHRLRDYVVLAVCAAAAVATKDQAYALYLGLPLVVVPSLDRHRRASGEGGGIGATLRDRRMVSAALAGAGAYLVLGGALVNPTGVRAHVELITGSASRDFRMFPPTPGGQAALLARTVGALSFSLGWPALLACAAGIASSVRRGDVRRLVLLVPALGYYAGFVAVVLYTYDRFLLPVILVLAPFGGAALATAWRAPGPARPWGRVAVASVLVVTLARALSVDLLLRADSRYTLEGWLRENVPASRLVAAVGPLEYLPRLEGHRWRRLGPSVPRLLQVRPDVVVVNADHAARAEPATADRALYDGLADGSLGYRLLRRQEIDPGWSLIDPRRLRAQDTGVSNLDKVGPTILVYGHDGAHPPSPHQE